MPTPLSAPFRLAACALLSLALLVDVPVKLVLVALVVEVVYDAGSVLLVLAVVVRTPMQMYW